MEGESTNRGRGASGSVASQAFHFVAWDGGCLFIGRGGGVVPSHAHYAIQIAFGSEPGIRFRAGEVPAKEGVVQGVSCMSLRADEVVAVTASPSQPSASA